MGTCRTVIAENYTYAMVCGSFFDAYNDGSTPEEASEIAREMHAEEFEDCDTRNDALFALAHAKWETKCLDDKLLEDVKTLILTGADLTGWKDRDASREDLKKRNKVLLDFLTMIKTPRPTKKRRKKRKFDYKEKCLLKLTAPDNKKTFTVSESWVNNEYQSTSGLLMWGDNSGGGILHYQKADADIQARWTGVRDLEVTLERTIELSQQRTKCKNLKDIVTIVYQYND